MMITKSCYDEKKLMQCMIDTFHMKALKAMEKELKRSVKELFPLLKKENFEVEKEEGSISVKQIVKMENGSIVTLRGSFKKLTNSSHSRSIRFPLLEQLDCSVEQQFPPAQKTPLNAIEKGKTQKQEQSNFY